jgi:hypothetical protein
MRPLRVLALPALLLSVLAGCSETHVTRPVSRVPAADSPEGVVRLFEWSWNNMDLVRYQEVFTEDFQFVFAPGVSAGSAYSDDPFGRDDMLACARHLFVGGGDLPPAASIVLVMDAVLHPVDDTRPGKDPRWHKVVATSVNLTIDTVEDSRYFVTGNATFYVVRGDSAAIPPDLGFEPDSTRWYVERWEDYTLSDGVALSVASTQPARATTWGSILALYR